MDDPPGSRLFVVCGKTAEEELLRNAFVPYGTVTNVKVIRDKGVAYVKFDKASCAADAMENLNGAVLNNGRGPKLKVLLAESPNQRNIPPTRHQVEMELACDPDNIPPRSRLFLVVPKTADPQMIKDEMSKFPDMEYCKTDLIQSKGVVFCKYSKASAALKAMEYINDSNTLAGYRVKCMLAEPKHKRARAEGLIPAFVQPVQNPIDFGDFGMSAMHVNGPHGLQPLHTFPGINGLSTQGALNSMNGIGISSLPVMSNSLSKMNGSLMLSAMNNGSMLGTPNSVRIGTGMDAGFSPMSANSPGMCGRIDEPHCLTGSADMTTYPSMDTSPNRGAESPVPLSKLRLFVVVYKGVSEDMLARLFRKYPGMEYCDLKKDKKTNRSKGYCYVNYSTHESAALAVQHLNGIEFPPQSSHRLKVMFAEPLGVKPSHTPRHVVPPPSFDSGPYDSQGMEGCPNPLDERLMEDAESANGAGFAMTEPTTDESKVLWRG